jgi:Leucine-rich repeat (LRR) protein
MCEICKGNFNAERIQVCKNVKNLPNCLPNATHIFIEYNWRITKLCYSPKCIYFSCRSSNICHISKKYLPNVKQLNISFSKIRFIPENLKPQLIMLKARGIPNLNFFIN